MGFGSPLKYSKKARRFILSLVNRSSFQRFNDCYPSGLLLDPMAA